MSSTWIITVGDKKVDINDIPLADWDAIEKATDHSYWELLVAPLRQAQAALKVYEAAAKVAGVDVADKLAKLTPRQVLDSFELSDDDGLPDQFEDGVPQKVDDTSTSS